MNFISKFFGKSEPTPTPSAVVEPEPVAPQETRDDVIIKYLGDLGAQASTDSYYSGFGFDGEKFAGGMNDYSSYYDYGIDYDMLQRRSGKLFRENLYARGLIRRLITNEITTGLQLEATPEESIIGVAEDSLEDWSEEIENRFSLWAKSKKQCCYSWKMTFSKIQRQARMEALIAGDVLVILHNQNGQPSVELVRGELVRTPLMTSEDMRNREIVDGVEMDKRGRHVAYWVTQGDGTSKRVAAYGSKTKRRGAWLIYGTEKRTGEVRGTPLLSLVIQSLAEIDRYRDSAQRKALINSLLAIFIQKDEDKPGTQPLSGGATRKQSGTVTDVAGNPRTFSMADQLPGMAIETLQHGEKPVAFGNDGTDINFGTFEEAIIQGIAWGYEIPPEILRLAFTDNYSASQAAINEFKIYLNKVRTEFGEDFCQPIYEDWLISQVLTDKVQKIEILRAFNNPADFDIYAAWVSADWAGAIKPSTDLKKMADGYTKLIGEGLITRDRSAKETTGTKFSKNVKKLSKENAMLADALRPILELKAEFGEDKVNELMADAGIDTVIADHVGEALENAEL